MINLKSLNLGKYESGKQYLRYLSALNRFLEKYLPKIKHTHVFVTGSFAKGKLHRGSDLDLDIIHSDTKRTIVKRIKIDDINIEYATFSFEMIEKKLRGEVYYNNTELLADAVIHWKMIAGDQFPYELVNIAKQLKDKTKFN